MDDLTSLSFTSTSKSSTSNYNTPGSKQSPAPPYSNTNIAALRPTPAATTQRGTSPSNVNGASKPATDSFANLLNFGRNNANNTANLSLQEQQRRLQEAKTKAEEEKRKQMDAQFGNSQFWDTLGGGVSNASGGGTGTGALASLGFKVPTPSSKPQLVVKQEEDDEDLFAAFRASAPVDKTSHFPPPASGAASAVVTPRFGTPAPPPQQQMKKTDMTSTLDMDDPFDLMNLPSRTASSAPSQPATTSNDDDDFLGLLGKPVSELPPKPPVEQPKQEKPPTPSPAAGGDPRDAAIAELMDMGFSLAQSRKALAETDTGLDIQQAVGWLLNEAHRQSKAVSGASSTSTPVSSQRDRSRDPAPDRNRRPGGREDARRDASSSRRRDGSEHRQPAWASSGGSGGGEKDIAAIASEVGSNLFKSANSLWSVGKKKMEKAMKELQQAQGDGGDDMPKWMRDAQVYQREEETRGPSPDSRGSRREGAAAVRGDHDSGDRRRIPEQQQQRKEELLTDEALMLEMGSGPPPRKSAAAKSTDRHHQPHPEPPSRGQSVSPLPPQARQSPADLQRQRQLDFAEQIRKKEIELREREAKIAMERKAKLGRGMVAEEPEVYISPSRRRGKPTPAPTTTSKVEEGDLLGGAGAIRPTEPPRNQQQQRGTPSPAPPAPTKASTPTPLRKAVPKRPAVHISPSDLAKSTQSRLKGSEAFKLGDYSLALTHYSSALSPLPPNHTLRILLLCNRAICNLKVGDAKACLVDCEDALELIGEGRGDGEMVFIGNSEERDMSAFWEKAIARKAEGLEALEKWKDAGKTWGLLVETGKGGPNALKGRARCEKAIAPKAPPAAAAPRPQATPRRPPAQQQQVRARPAPPQNQEAVNKLREANNAAEAVEREKLELYDGVSERINSWKKGKEGNLRALLTSLDQILWEGCGWQKITMGQLVIPSKVKIWYMKGIAKVHPDKIPQDATTEQRMICGTVFSLLNEAWDKFKVDNNL